MYDNVALLKPDGCHLGYVSLKRASWYIRKDLGEYIQPSTLRLKFEPKEHTDSSNYALEVKMNKCVVCGTTEELSKHHIVPYSFRKYMPYAYKSRNMFDVLCVCRSCHNRYHTVADKFIKDMYLVFGINETESKKYKKLAKMAKALHNHWDKIPPRVREENLLTLGENFGYTIRANLTEIIRFSELKLNSMARVEQTLVIEFEREFGLRHFVKMWRKHFIQTSKPKFLSQEWLNEIDAIRM